MFGSSSVLNRHRQKTLENQTTAKNATHASAHTTVSLMTASRCLQQNAEKMHAAASDFDDVRRLHHVVESFGMSKAVMAMLPDDIHETLPGFPAIESLDQMPLRRHDPRTGRILEGLSAAMEQEPTFVKMWVSDVRKNICSQLDLLGIKAAGYREQAAFLRDSLRGAYVSEAVLKEVLVWCLPVKKQLKLIETLEQVVSGFDIPDETSTKQDLETSMDLLKGMVEQISPITGICFNDAGRVTFDSDKVADDYWTDFKNLHVMGYSVEDVVELCDAVIILTNALTALANKKPDIEARLQSIADGLDAPASSDSPENGETTEPSDDEQPEITRTPAEEPSEAATYGETDETSETTSDQGTSTEESLNDQEYSMTAHRQILCAWVGLLGSVSESCVSTISSSMMVAERVEKLA